MRLNRVVSLPRAQLCGGRSRPMVRRSSGRSEASGLAFTAVTGLEPTAPGLADLVVQVGKFEYAVGIAYLLGLGCRVGAHAVESWQCFAGFEQLAEIERILADGRAAVRYARMRKGFSS